MKVYLHGQEKINWSLSRDYRHTQLFLQDIGHELTRNFLAADVVHSVWWNALLKPRYFPLRCKRIIAVTSNFIDLSKPQFNCSKFRKANKFVNLWVTPSRNQYIIFQKNNIPSVYQPFYVEEQLFHPIQKSRRELASLLGIDYNLIKDKFLIGSFQRDSLGADLSRPKWQKDPDCLITILKDLKNKDKWLLVLVGPRRHYVINKCKKHDIPYYYYGEEPSDLVDDIHINNTDLEKMPLLYDLIDVYLVTSKTEGGPKAVIEASLCKTLIFSTNVGLAPDILEKNCIFSEKEELLPKLIHMIGNQSINTYEYLIEKNYNNAKRICSYEAIKDRWEGIYEAFQN